MANYRFINTNDSNNVQVSYLSVQDKHTELFDLISKELSIFDENTDYTLIKISKEEVSGNLIEVDDSILTKFKVLEYKMATQGWDVVSEYLTSEDFKF